MGIVIAALVVAAPALAAVGAASGWFSFSAGKPDLFYPANARDRADGGCGRERGALGGG
ncbi:MAG TPA: hypothetical protein VMB05_15910 [Solirubrobacteraceae bacterium]|nr:hypothetical protein [Solirubrobacteraceae bacterium]